MIFLWLDLLIIVAGFVTSYLVSLYSLAVYIDPDEVESLFPKSSKRRQTFLKKLAADPRAFVQIASIYKSFALIGITLSAAHGLLLISDKLSLPTYMLTVPGLFVVWLMYIVFAEYLPRRSSMTAIDQHLERHIWLMAAIYLIFFPVVQSYRTLLSRINLEKHVTEEEKEEIVERAIETLAEQAGIGEAIVEEDEKEMIGQIFQLDQTVVREIMIPRIDITAIDKSMNFMDMREIVRKDGHSRYPVYDGTVDKIVGLIYVKDVFNNLPDPGEKFVVEKYLRKPYFVPETKVIGELLTEFKSRHLHIAIVLDEYGGVAGLVTLEDIIEEIFGEIQDEHDWESAEITELPDGRYLVNASMLVEELQDHIGSNYQQGDYDTVGGLIYDLVGSVPKDGQVIQWHDYEFEIDRIEGQRILFVKIRKYN